VQKKGGFQIKSTLPPHGKSPDFFVFGVGMYYIMEDRQFLSPKRQAFMLIANPIKQSVNTKLDMLLSVFGQENFVSEDKTVKDFPAEVDCPEMKEVLSILNYVAVDAKARKELDEEIYYQNYVESMFGEHIRKIEDLSQKMLKVAKRLKDASVPVNEISEETGLSIEEIERL